MTASGFTLIHAVRNLRNVAEQATLIDTHSAVRYGRGPFIARYKGLTFIHNTSSILAVTGLINRARECVKQCNKWLTEL